MVERKREERELFPFYWNPFIMLRNLENIFESVQSTETQSSSMKMPMVDLRDDGNEYLLEADLPGIAKEDIEINVDKKSLILRARRERDKEDRADAYIHRERSTSSLYRTISLPNDVDYENISARLNNGVLVVKLPKKENDRGKRKVNIE
ncbi:MAG: Hsp20/alpha crystallin family protein [Euryarchaeota archaeon]|nr:Hsp20/alpha crystallin family protein [Euryarchaeota archaeon]